MEKTTDKNSPRAIREDKIYESILYLCRVIYKDITLDTEKLGDKFTKEYRYNSKECSELKEYIRLMKDYFDRYKEYARGLYPFIRFEDDRLSNNRIFNDDFGTPLGTILCIDGIFREKGYIMEMSATLKAPMFFGKYKLTVKVEFSGKSKIIANDTPSEKDES